MTDAEIDATIAALDRQFHAFMCGVVVGAMLVALVLVGMR